ncbi:MAG: hypothetical protein OSA23_01570 [Rhodospirillales bacterium]|nr:hypothetical protein [Rhodospirillales bacterium]
MMTLYNRTIHKAVGTSAGVGPLIRHSGRAWVHVGRIRTVQLARRVYWLCLAHWPGYCCSSQCFGSTMGVRLAHGITKRQLELTFAFFMCLISIRFAFSL